MPTSFACVGRVEEVVKVLCSDAVDARWYVKEVEGEFADLGVLNYRRLQDPVKPNGDLVCGSWLCGFAPTSRHDGQCSRETLGRRSSGKWCRNNCNYLPQGWQSFVLPEA